MLHHRQVVGDEQVGQPEILLQLPQEVDDLRLDRYVQRGDRLVADDEFRIESERSCDADTLALAAGELMRIAVLVVLLQAALAHNVGDVIVQLIGRNDVVLAHRLADDLADGQTRRQAGIRILEDDLQLGAHLAQLLAGEGKNVDPVEVDLAGGLVLQTQDRAADGGLAAARLAHETHGGAALDAEGNAVHRFYLTDRAAEEAALDREVLHEVLDFQKVIRTDLLICHPSRLPSYCCNDSSSPSAWARS